MFLVFFREKKKCSHFFRPIGATIDIEKSCKMRLLSLSEALVQSRKGPDKFAVCLFLATGIVSVPGAGVEVILLEPS